MNAAGWMLARTTDPFLDLGPAMPPLPLAVGRGRSHQAGHPIPIRVYSPDSAAEHQVRYCGNEQEGAMRKA